MRLDDSFAGAPGQHGSDVIVRQLPSVNSTNLGPGRNKLFIRGVADSSFTGPTQATVGQYFGSARLNYNAPDPDNDLHDLHPRRYQFHSTDRIDNRRLVYKSSILYDFQI